MGAGMGRVCAWAAEAASGQKPEQEHLGPHRGDGIGCMHVWSMTVQASAKPDPTLRGIAGKYQPRHKLQKAAMKMLICAIQPLGHTRDIRRGGVWPRSGRSRWWGVVQNMAEACQEHQVVRPQLHLRPRTQHTPISQTGLRSLKTYTMTAPMCMHDHRTASGKCASRLQQESVTRGQTGE